MKKKSINSLAGIVLALSLCLGLLSPVLPRGRHAAEEETDIEAEAETSETPDPESETQARDDAQDAPADPQPQADDENGDHGAEETGDSAQEELVIDPMEVYSRDLLKYIPQVEQYISYEDYLSQHAAAPCAESTIDLLAADSSEDEDESAEEGAAATSGERLSQEGEHLEFSFDAPETGLYELEIHYRPGEGSGTEIERAFYLDGEIPYAELSTIALKRNFTDKEAIDPEIEGNQSFPAQVEEVRELRTRLKDLDGFYPDPLLFYLTEGEHQLSIEALKESMTILSLRFVPHQNPPAYEDYLAEHLESGAPIIEHSRIERVQGEDARYKSSPSLYPLNDRTSPMTEPYHPTYIRMNMIGGQAWDTPRDWLLWEVEVPETGLYRLNMRFLQNLTTGLHSTRRLTIDGEIPFKEAEALRFPYGSGWQRFSFEDETGNVRLIYLEEGTHEIGLEVDLSDFGALIRRVERTADELGRVAQKIIVITSTTPDPYRDYQLDKRLPEMLPSFREAKGVLEDVIQSMLEATGGRSDKTAPLEQTAVQLGHLLDKPRKIAKELGALQNNITSLGDWALNMKSQSLSIDYFDFLGQNDPNPPINSSFGEKFRHEVQAFLGSFYNDYTSAVVSGRGAADDAAEDTTEDTAGNAAEDATKRGAGDDEADDQLLTVWVSTGRDQMDIVKRLISESFDPEIPVNLRLVSSAVALSATAAGRGPDVIIQTDSAQPIDFAFRDAAYDLSQFPDFEEVYDRFHPATMEGFEFLGGYYALPDQMSFPVLFYRADILSELQIPVPQTWQDILTITPFLQGNNMEFFMDVSPPPTLGTATQSTTKAINPIFLSLLYQHGQPLYNEEGSVALTDTPEALQLFETWTDYYTKHSFPVSVNFVTRFRLGSVPLAIVNFTNYNTLSVSAPEIRGDWAIAPIPGTRQEDGSIDRSLPVTTSAAMIVKRMVEQNGNVDAAWSFLKWWTSQETQTAFANEMESILGPSARYPVANLESFKSSPWERRAMAVLDESLRELKGIRQVPGSYITGRNIENAFYEVVNDAESSNPDRALISWTENINYELQSKREEFGLPTEDPSGSVKSTPGTADDADDEDDTDGETDAPAIAETNAEADAAANADTTENAAANAETTANAAANADTTANTATTANADIALDKEVE